MNAVLKIGDEIFEPARFDRTFILQATKSGLLERLGRFEVIDGVLVQMSPSYSLRGATLYALSGFFASTLPKTYRGLADTMVFFGEANMRAPDIAIVDRGPVDKIVEARDVRLAVEIADSSLAQDLGEKARFYAAHGIPDYWVIDLLNKRLVLHRNPSETGYGSVTEQSWSDTASPLIAPEVQMVLSDVLAD